MNESELVKDIEEKVVRVIKKENLITKDDKILIGLSGGKDSTTLLYLLKDLVDNEIEAVTIDGHIEDYSIKSNDIIIKQCKELGIKLHIISTHSIFGKTLDEAQIHVSKNGKINHCTICGIIKRYMLNKFAKDKGFTAIATGHNRDDIVEAILMNFLRGKGELSARLGPISGVKKSKGFVKRIKPLYLCAEDKIKEYSKIKKFEVNYDPCPYSEDSYRSKVKYLMWDLEENNPGSLDLAIDNFLDNTLPMLREKFQTTKEIPSCESCGEPTSQVRCATCDMLDKIKAE